MRWKNFAPAPTLIQLYTGLVYAGPGLVARHQSGAAAGLRARGAVERARACRAANVGDGHAKTRRALDCGFAAGCRRPHLPAAKLRPDPLGGICSGALPPVRQACCSQPWSFGIVNSGGPYSRRWFCSAVAGLVALDYLAPPLSAQWGGTLFLGAIGLSFLTIYVLEHARWWAIIPGGVLITLAAVAGLDRSADVQAGGLFFLGLGGTFILVALAPNPHGQMRWAFFPAAVLLILGLLLFVGLPGSHQLRLAAWR